MPITIQHLLQQCQQKLVAQLGLTRQDAQFETQLLLQTVLKVNRAWLIAHESEMLAANDDESFEGLLNRRAKGEPIAHIIGYREFYGLRLKVTLDTLIPRPDTETLVEAALTKIPITAHSNILDLGTGTGAIALAIAHNRLQSNVIATDISQQALNVAIENATNLTIQNVQFIQSDWFLGMSHQQFDVIVSNPPYIEADDIHLSQGDLRFEPLSALASGKDGLDDIRRIAHSAPNHLKPNGWLMFEHGYKQAQHVADIMAENGFSQISHMKDLAGILRVTMGQLSKL
ncbi:MAG: peptide chain release factor N(5)-glutamine methyltransferase [Methylotenera sp.]|nr:peptide chain release factor N(5)-glutamine methyltransferase [Methylotenera sp.]